MWLGFVVKRVWGGAFFGMGRRVGRRDTRVSWRGGGFGFEFLFL